LSEKLLFWYYFYGTDVPPRMKGEAAMKEKYITEILDFIKELDENQLQYILTFIKKLFGGR